MKIKSLLLASSLLLTSAAFADDNSLVTKTIYFTIDNKTGSVVKDLSVFSGITNLTPTKLAIKKLPVGVSRFEFDVVNIGQSAGVALLVQNSGSNYITTSAGITPEYAPYLNYSCQSSGTLAVTCHADSSPDGIYNVSVDVFKN